MKSKLSLTVGFIIFFTSSCQKEEVKILKPISIEVEQISPVSAILAAVVEVGQDDIAGSFGVCWSLNEFPDIKNDEKSSYIVSSKLEKKSGYVERYTAALSSLLPNTTYYCRAYAERPGGHVFYGKVLSFKTKNGGIIKDLRDNQDYPYAQIGTYTWMLKNLNYASKIGGSLFYKNDSARYASSYGRLYNFASACKACPDGWHLPSDVEWQDLEKAAAVKQSELAIEGKRGNRAGWILKEAGYEQWLSDTDKIALVTNSTGFSARASGQFDVKKNKFSDLGTNAVFYSATVVGTTVYARSLSLGHEWIGRGLVDSTTYISVRCVRDY